MLRVVSFLPAGTEIAFAIGAGPDLVGRSHECDYPEDVIGLPVVSRPALNLTGLSQPEVDRAVAKRLRSGESLYEVDEALLRDLAPDVILTQDLCQVCAPSGNELGRALRELPGKPKVVWLSPRTLSEIEQNILAVGEATGRAAEARELVASNRDRISQVGQSLRGAPPPSPRRVSFLEWLDPLFSAGHWVPEMIERAGGVDPMGRSGMESVRVTVDQVRAAKPEVVIFAPCGFGLGRAVELGRSLPDIPNSRAYAVDANAYFARPGPRVAEGIELLAHLFHPDRVAWPHSERPWLGIGTSNRASVEPAR
ncbi:MAG TPA: cobalamin-binding protein [Gemmatimonadales bacterium]|nr:cobalamin-binding protein [Gemmatimonadales bacterium]